MTATTRAGTRAPRPSWTTVARYSQHAIRGEQTFHDPWGTAYTLPQGSNHYWVDNSGATWGTDTYAPPDYHTWYHPLTPVE
jgi:hypothetical protein